jgi:hydrogenase nickel incorporation protein HypB
MDLLPHVPFDLEAAMGHARDVNPRTDFFFTSSVNGDGMDEWTAFLRELVHRRSRRPAMAG